MHLKRQKGLYTQVGLKVPKVNIFQHLTQVNVSVLPPTSGKVMMWRSSKVPLYPQGGVMYQDDNAPTNKLKISHWPAQSDVNIFWPL